LKRVVPLALLSAALCARAAEPLSTRELTELSLDELANIEITSVSKKAESLADAPASVFVITADDIRRSGATSLPEALRLAPNLQVAQVGANNYAIRARGMVTANSGNTLLVLIDGRSVYSPLFSGVFWDVQQVMLEDVERIEVISGPGGTLWGVNAVNGVINVITRSARNTQGGLLASGASNRESSGAVRYGAPTGGDGHFRAYAKYVDREHTETANGTPISDASHLAQAGFRADWQRERDILVLEGNTYQGTIGQPLPGTISISGVGLELAPIPVSGVNLTGSWTRRLGGGSQLTIQSYYDRTERTVPPTFGEKLDLVDVQVQHSFEVAAAHTVVWGGEYRFARDRVANSDIFAFLPPNVDQRWSSLFAQSESALRTDLRLTFGARLERNDYTGNEFLPSARLAWKPSAEGLLWAAASRAVRAPSRLDRDTFVPGRPPFLLEGGPLVRSEVARVYEIGYRGQLQGSTSYSATVFHADYDHMHTQEIAPSGTFLTFSDRMKGSTDGIEMWATRQFSPIWRVSAGFTAQRERLRLEPGSNDATAVATAGRDPAHSWLVRSSLNLAPRTELDVTVRGVARLADPDVPAYITGDVRIGWKPHKDLELSLAARNVGKSHGEFTDILTRTEIGRSVYAGIRWYFDGR
jgi:iron complex outermembrane receptor protein